MRILRATLRAEIVIKKMTELGYSKLGYVLGFYSDPNDTKGKFESVSSKKIFGYEPDLDRFDSLPTPENFVNSTS